MDEKLLKEIRDMRDDVIKIKSTLENFATTLDLKLISIEDRNKLAVGSIEEKLKVANHRIEDLEDANKWLWRTVVGALIVGVVAYFFK